LLKTRQLAVSGATNALNGKFDHKQFSQNLVTLETFIMSISGKAVV